MNEDPAFIKNIELWKKYFTLNKYLTLNVIGWFGTIFKSAHILPVDTANVVVMAWNARSIGDSLKWHVHSLSYTHTP